MKVSYLGTTTLLFDDGKDQVLFDCHVTRPSIRTCIKGMLDSNDSVVDKVISDFKINRLKAIFVSHSHHDHVMDAPSFALKCDSDIYGSESTRNIAIGNGVKEDRIYCYSDSMNYKIGDYIIQIIPSIHSEPHWYNDDIGQTVDEPFAMPAPKKAFKEGGSFDFLIMHNKRTYLIRPSYNYLDNQLDNIKAEVLFLGIGGMANDTGERRDKFFEETIDKVNPQIVIPIHWDNFFTPVYGEVKAMPKELHKTGKAMRILSNYCVERDIQCIVQLPLSSMII